MGIKENIQARVEKNAVKIPDLVWTDNKGNIHTEQVLLKRSRLPLVGDWARVYPPTNEDGSWNFSNLIFGGKQNFFRLLIVMVILSLLFYQIVSLLGISREYMDGRKYIIIGRDSFDKFCVTSVKDGTGYIETLPNNASIFIWNKTIT